MKKEHNPKNIKEVTSLFLEYHNGRRTGVGSFEENLYKTFYSAGESNREKLVNAFPEYFNGIIEIKDF